MPVEPSGRAVVRTLCGARWQKVARFALGRAREALGADTHLVVHDDGGLGEEGRARIAEGAGDGVRFVGAAEADARVLPLLAGHPATLAWRRRDPLARKLLDVVLLAEGTEVAFMDTDVLWLRRAGWLLAPLPAEVDGIFTAQVPGEEGLAVSPVALASGRVRVARGINTGVFRVRTRLLDLDRVEAILRVLPAFRPGDPRSFWVEQTLWAALALGGGCRRWDFAAMTIPRSDRELHVPVEGVTALHCVGPVRLAFWHWKHRPLGDPLPVESAPVARLGALDAWAGFRRVRSRVAAAE